MSNQGYLLFQRPSAADDCTDKNLSPSIMVEMQNRSTDMTASPAAHEKSGHVKTEQDDNDAAGMTVRSIYEAPRTG